MKFSLEDLLKGTGGNLVSKAKDSFSSFSTDSRNIMPGEIFVPLKGENFDGHDFIESAILKGAAAVITEKNVNDKRVTVIKVEDALKAFQSMSHYWRKKNKAKIVGITGSNGKTTTKFFLKNLLENDYKVFASEKSYNNHFGVPITLLQIDRDTEVCIVEIGMNHPGEIQNLTLIAEPDVVLCTTVGEAHIGMLGTKDKIAAEKAEIYNHPLHDPLRVYNLDNPWTQKMYLTYKNPTRALTFSMQNPKADIFFQIVSESFQGINIEGKIKDVSGRAQLEFFGGHNIVNLMGAAGLALWCGLTPEQIWERLPYCRTTWGRNQIIELSSKAKLVFDGYNANPDSMRALIENGMNMKVKGKKILVLGEMKELGDLSIARHEDLGQWAGRANFDVVWFMGEHAPYFERGIKTTGFSKKLMITNDYEDSLASELGSMLEPEDIVLVKGSRGAKMERIVPHLNPVNWSNKK